MNNQAFRRAAGALTALALVFAAAGTGSAAVEYDDFEEITSHVTTSVKGELSVTRPAGDIETDAANYYLTGGSDPQESLTLNGEAVPGRGIFGSWGAYVPLQEGKNVFTLRSGAQEKTVTITRGAAAVGRTKSLSQPAPAADRAGFSGEEITLRCVAPSGGKVTASAGGTKLALRQKAAASGGVPAVFEGTLTLPKVSGTKEIGPVTYTLSYEGEVSNAVSAGSLFACGEGETLLVEMTDASSTLFAEESTSSGFVATAKQGAVDYVAQAGETMYRLGSGGWVLHSVAKPLVSPDVGWKNKVSSVRFEKDENEERLVFEGTGRPVFRASQDERRLLVRFAHTSGVGAVSTSGSRLFSGAEVREEDGGTSVELSLSGKRRLWGYLVEYEGGNTVLTCKYAPSRASGSKPLSGVTVALDPGHGGADPGAPGVPYALGPMEEQINFDTAQAVRKRLEKLGADVVMTRGREDTVSLSERISASTNARADFFVALHSNATAVNVNGLKPRGVEVYYYEDGSQAFAQQALAALSARTGRQARWARYSNFKVTLNTLCPAVLVEMGYLTNPAEYDALCSRRGMFQVANGVADAILASL